MKKLITLASLVCLVVSTNSNAAETNKEIYLNKDLGFNIKGYKYDQKELPCNVDSYLVERITAKAKDKNIQVNTVSTGQSIGKSDVPIMAIEINKLALGKKGFNFGGKTSSSVLPSMQVTVGLLRNDKQGGDVLAKHSCAILTLNQVSPANSSVLDMGTYGMTVCDATRKCLNDLSKDIVDWAAPQL